jgi:molybdopterin-binding protein
MQAGVRNQMSGKITEVKTGDVMSQVTMQVGDNMITSVMTTESLNDAGLFIFKDGKTL